MPSSTPDRQKIKWDTQLVLFDLEEIRGKGEGAKEEDRSGEGESGVESEKERRGSKIQKSRRSRTIKNHRKATVKEKTERTKRGEPSQQKM